MRPPQRQGLIAYSGSFYGVKADEMLPELSVSFDLKIMGRWFWLIMALVQSHSQYLSGYQELFLPTVQGHCDRLMVKI